MYYIYFGDPASYDHTNDYDFILQVECEDIDSFTEYICTKLEDIPDTSPIYVFHDCSASKWNIRDAVMYTQGQFRALQVNHPSLS